MREIGLLESAVYRPQATFGGSELYPDLYLKAAALIHSLIRNHPFVDGNKRTGFEAMRLFLWLNAFDIHASEEKKFKFVMKIANEKTFSEIKIAEWLRKNCKRS